MNNYAVILTHNRPEMVIQAIQAISPQVDRVHVVDNASTPPLQVHDGGQWPLNVVLYHNPTQPPNLAKMWNEQLHLIEKIARAAHQSEWNVALLCDDAFAPEGWFEAVQHGMRTTGAVLGCTSAWDGLNQHLLKTEHDGNIFERLVGCAFVMAGEKGLRADESMHWWWCDTDLDWQARKAGGMVICPGPVVLNALPNVWTNVKHELGTRAGVDHAAFVAKWGSAPW